MATPGYAIKHWWRAARRPGESLKVFARRHAAGPNRNHQTGTTSWEWLRRKQQEKKR